MRVIAALCVLCISLFALASVAGENGTSLETRGAAVEDSVERNLWLVRAPIRDRKGAVVSGLTASDFRVSVDGVHWPIEYVDEICPESTWFPSSHTGPMQASMMSSEIVEQAFKDERSYLSLYFDLGAMRLPSIRRAAAAAEQWLNLDTSTHAKMDSSVSIVAQSGGALYEVAPFTDDRSILQSAIGIVGSGKIIQDPFPAFLSSRVRECGSSGATCLAFAKEEKRHNENTLGILERYIAGLERYHGRKTLVYFHETTTLFPSRLYSGSCSLAFKVGDNVSLAERLAGIATANNMVIHVAYSGSRVGSHGSSTGGALDDHAVNFGANLADYSGGKYNRGPGDLVSLLRGAAQGECFYQFALAVPKGFQEKEGTYRVVIRPKRPGVKRNLRYTVNGD